MKKAFKFAGVIIGVLLLTILIALSTIYFMTQSRWNKTYDVTSELIEIPSDSLTIAKGKHVFTIRGCVECHGENLGGKIFIEDPMVGRFVATNLTAGLGGIGSRYTDEDLIRSIRKGVKPNGKTVLFMPSHEYTFINKNDMAALIAYIRSADPIDNILPQNKISAPMRAIYLIGGEVHLFPAELIDQSLPIPLTEPQSVIEKGEYLAATCTGCHGRFLAGGPIPGTPPHWPPALNITPGGKIITWTEEDFFKAMREGITPDGRQLNNEYMPYEVFGNMTDDELHSLFAYLQLLEAREDGAK